MATISRMSRNIRHRTVVFLVRSSDVVTAALITSGGRGIRTPGTVPRTAVFKTAGFNRSPIPPFREYYLGCREFQVLDREVLFAIRFLRAESYRSRYGVGMFDGHRTEVGSSFNGNEVAALRFHVELISVAERDFQRKGFVSPVGTELDFGYGSHRHLAVNAALAIRQQCVPVPAFNEPAKLRVSDGDFHTVLESNNDRLAGRRGQCCLRRR